MQIRAVWHQALPSVPAKVFASAHSRQLMYANPCSVASILVQGAPGQGVLSSHVAMLSVAWFASAYARPCVDRCPRFFIESGTPFLICHSMPLSARACEQQVLRCRVLVCESGQMVLCNSPVW